MWVKYHGRTCIMVIDKNSSRIRFIRRRKWFDMTAAELEKYIY